MNSRTLKRHLKYIVPEMRLALLKEPGVKPRPIYSPDCLDKFVEPLKHYADFVPRTNMFRLDWKCRWLQAVHALQGT